MTLIGKIYFQKKQICRGLKNCRSNFSKVKIF